MPNYTLEYVYYDKDIHYFDGEKYQEISSLIEERNNTQIVKNNNYQVIFPNTINEDESIILEYKDYELSYVFENINNSSIISSNEGQYSKMTYEEILDNVDLEYYVLNEQLKENIVINEYIENFSISYLMNTNGLTLVEENNQIYLKNENNDDIFEILPLYMIDDDNLKSNDIETIITKINNDTYRITIIPSSDYLEKATYPVVIDPIVSVETTTETLSENGISFRTKTYLCGYSSSYPFSNSLYVGIAEDDYYGIIEFTRGTTTDKDDARIVFSNVGVGSGGFNVYRLSSSYNYDDLTGTSFPTDGETYIGTGLYTDNTTEIAYNNVFETGQKKSILVFKPYGEGHVRISDTGYSVAPFLKITNVSIKNQINTTYYDMENDSIGTGKVNLASGILTYNISNYTFEHNNNPFNIEHIYSSENLSNIGYGVGWSINYLEKLTNVNNEESTIYFLEKASRERFSFSKNSDTGNFESLNSSDTIIVEDDKYILYTNGMIKVYEVLDIGDSTTAYLTYIKSDSDYVGDIRIKHKLNNNLVVIDEIIDGAGNKASFYYNNTNGYLSEIEYTLKTYDNPLEPATSINISKIVQYQYSGMLLQYIWKTDYRDSKILDKSRIKLEYSRYRLTKAYKETIDSVYDDDPIIYQMGKLIIYDSSNMVSKIETFDPSNSNASLDATFIYGNNKAKVEKKDSSIIYWFDIYGNVIKEVDNFGNITTYKYDNTYYNQNNLVSSQYQPGSIYNYITNPAFLNNDGWNIEKEVGVGSIDKVQSILTLGQYQIELNRTTEGVLSYYQNVTLKPGRYVVSSNIKNDNSIGIAEIVVTGTNIETITSSKKISNSNGEYQKYYVEFNVLSETTVKISLESTSIGKAYFDYVCLNSTRENFVQNLVENSSFEDSSYLENPYWNGMYDIIESETNNEFLGNKSLVVFYNDYVYQTINTGGFKGDRFDISLVMNPYSQSYYPHTYLEVVIEFNNSDNTKSQYYIKSLKYSEFEENFDTEFLYASVYAPKTYSSVTIKMKPESDEGTCSEVIFVDNVSLSKTTSDVTNLTNEINDLPTTITLENKETIQDLHNRYLILSEVEQSLLTNKNTLLDKVKELHVLEFTTKLNELPTTITTQEIEQVENVELLYNDLKTEELALISDSLKETYLDMVKQKNVCYVIDLINKLPNTISKDNYQEVIDVQNEYDSLTETEKGLITNYTILETKIKDKNIIQVNVLIEQLPTTNIFEDDNISDIVLEEQASLIIETEELYNALSNTDKAQVENVTILQNAITYKNSYLTYNLDFEEVKVITKLEDYGYDNQYKITDIDEFGNITQYTYNTISGILESIEDPLGNITEYYYAAFDYLQELKQIIDEETKTSVNYTYDKLGRLKTISKNGTTYTFSYNILNEITKIERDLVTILEITYLEENSIPTTYVSSYIYSGTTTISYIYDENKQIIETKYNNTTQYTNKYDLLGNVVETNNINDNYKYYYIYSYDGTLQQLIDSNGNSIIYKENGKVIKTFDNEYEINYNHNEEEKLISETHDDLQISYSEQINDDGELLSESIIYSIDNEQILKKDVYYNKSQVSKIDYIYSDKKVSINYTYDFNNNIKTITTNTYNEEDELINTRIEEYSYDSLNQLSNHKVYNNNIQILDVIYTYDFYGNILSILRNIHLNEYSSLPGYEEYIYDETYKDLLETKYEKESLTGNIINTYNYIYDSTNTNLLEVKKNNTTIENYTYLNRNLITYTNETTRIEYKYNSDGIRYQKNIYDKATNELIESRKYFLDEYKIISEEVTNNVETYSIYYKYDNNDQVIGYTYKTESNSSEYTYIKNYQGDIIGIIDETKELSTQYIYDAYGQVISGDTETNSLLYRSYYYDQETSYYYLNSRYYCPKNARFQIADEITYLGIIGTVNSYNLFSYCENEPINHMDEDGHEICILSMTSLLAICVIVILFTMLASAIARNPNINSNRLRWDIDEAIENFKEKVKNLGAYLVKLIVSTRIFKHETERHHIIARIHPRAKEARDIFVKKCGRNINDEENIARVRTKYHKVMHTIVYFDAINDCIGSAYQTGGDSAVITVLKELQEALEKL